MPNRRHSSRRFTPSCSNNITNSCRCDMIDCSDHGTPAPPPQANNADTMRQPCPRTPVHYLSRPYTFARRGEATMTEVLYNPKIKPEHLARKAIFYLRQSSEKQVRQNKESQLLQYAVAERVRALGWKQVEIINSDLGSSAGLGSAQREGFERVLSLVALGEVGIVVSREVSRLSRTDKDW